MLAANTSTAANSVTQLRGIHATRGHLHHESPFGSRRNSTISTASDGDTSNLSNRSHMPPIEIPFDLSALGLFQTSNPTTAQDGDINEPHRNVSSGNSIRRYNQHFLDGAGNNALSMPSSGENSRGSSGSGRRHSSFAVDVTPVNPSIPQPRSGADLHVGARQPPPTINIEPAPPLGAERKPPTGYTASGTVLDGYIGYIIVLYYLKNSRIQAIS